VVKISYASETDAFALVAVASAAVNERWVEPVQIEMVLAQCETSSKGFTIAYSVVSIIVCFEEAFEMFWGDLGHIMLGNHGSVLVKDDAARPLGQQVLTSVILLNSSLSLLWSIVL
jgi:hypothetical protein